MKALYFSLLIAGLVTAFACCSHPSAPSASDAVTISGPNSGFVLTSYTLKANINFTSDAALIYQWVFADTTISRVAIDSITRSFQLKDTGRQIFLLHVIRAGDSALLCSATDTISISDTAHPPPNTNDTTSHNFVWTEFTDVNGENNMTGCWVFGPKDIYALNGNLYHFDGASWTQAMLNGHAPGALSGASMFGFTDNDFWIIDGSIMYHWNGRIVEETRLENTAVWHYPQDGIIHSAWGASSNDMYFAGDSGTILHFDGTNWTKMNSGTTKELNSISGTSDNDIWAAGYNTSTGESELIHYNGASWTKDTLSLAGLTENWGINGVFASDSAGHQIVAATGWTIFQRTDHAPWRSDSGLVPNDIGGRIWMSGICGNGSNDLLGAGDGGLVVHWNGRSWKRYDQFLSISDQAYFPHQAAFQNNTACIVGYKDGQSWVLVGQRQ